MTIKTGHFVKGQDGYVYRLVGVRLDAVNPTLKLDKVDPKVAKKVTEPLQAKEFEPGSAVRIVTPDAEGILIRPGDVSGFDKDKDTP